MKHDSRTWICALLIATACADPGNADDEGNSSEAGTTGTATTIATTEATSADSSSGGSSSGGGVCVDEQPAIVTDIDETLTVSDEEFLMQVMDATYDPLERAGGAAMVTAYADLGYRIMYLSARAESLDILDSDETPREITERWLEEHGYPLDPETTLIVLSESFVVGDSAQAYKAAALMDQQALGWRFDYAYGNATSDIGAYADASLDLATTFIIGEHAGEGGTVAIAGEDWLAHNETHLPTVPAVCE